MRTIVGCLLALVAVGPLTIGCAASTRARSEAEGPMRGKPDEAAMPAPPQARIVHPGDLEVTLTGPGAIGPLREERRAQLPLSLRVTNRAREPLRVGRSVATIAVSEGARAVPGCAATPITVELPEVLPPGGTSVVQVTLPCALETPSDYDVTVELVAGTADTRASLLGPRFAGATALRVDEAMGPFGSPVMPTATVYAPTPGSTLTPPSPEDVRRERRETPSGAEAAPR